jgi:hypothetical protein
VQVGEGVLRIEGRDSGCSVTVNEVYVGGVLSLVVLYDGQVATLATAVRRGGRGRAAQVRSGLTQTAVRWGFIHGDRLATEPIEALLTAPHSEDCHAAWLSRRLPLPGANLGSTSPLG